MIGVVNWSIVYFYCNSDTEEQLLKPQSKRAKKKQRRKERAKERLQEEYQKREADNAYNNYNNNTTEESEDYFGDSVAMFEEPVYP